MKKVKLILTFYKSFALLSWIITLFCLAPILYFGLKPFTFLFWFKIITIAFIFYYHVRYKAEEFYYYKNLGVSRVLLHLSIFLFEIISYVLLVDLILLIK